MAGVLDGGHPSDDPPVTLASVVVVPFDGRDVQGSADDVASLLHRPELAQRLEPFARLGDVDGVQAVAVGGDRHDQRPVEVRQAHPLGGAAVFHDDVLGSGVGAADLAGFVVVGAVLGSGLPVDDERPAERLGGDDGVEGAAVADFPVDGDDLGQHPHRVKVSDQCLEGRQVRLGVRDQRRHRRLPFCEHLEEAVDLGAAGGGLVSAPVGCGGEVVDGGVPVELAPLVEVVDRFDGDRLRCPGRQELGPGALDGGHRRERFVGGWGDVAAGERVDVPAFAVPADRGAELLGVGWALQGHRVASDFS